MMTRLLIPVLAVSLTACAVEDGELPVDELDEVHPEKLSANALTPADLAAAGITAARLTQSVVTSVSQTREGRGALQYLINCAMPSTYSISATYLCGLNPCTVTYTGGINLVPAWTSQNLTQTQQRQLSGCVFGRLNELGKSIVVSLRGSGYSLDPTETTTHVYPEGAFFGNLFPGADNYWASCDLPGPTHQWRLCAQDGHCSMSWAGDCTTACTLDGSGNATSCTGANGVTYASPTTVFLDTVTP